MSTDIDVKEIVKARYGEAAARVAQGTGNSCCGGTPANVGGSDPITSDLYDAVQAGEVPAKAMLASLGCGNPTALAELKAGETVPCLPPSTHRGPATAPRTGSKC